MADILQITLPDGTTYDIKDNNALPLTGGTLTGDLILDNNANLEVKSTGRSSVVFNMTSLIEANTIGTLYQTTAYNVSGKQMKDITKAGIQVFKVPLIDNNTLKPAKFSWYYRSVDDSLDPTNYYEIYSLPAATNNLTAHASYDILTSKNAVTIAQGGTGATTAADAWTALGGGNVGKLTYSNNTNTYLRNDGTWATVPLIVGTGANSAQGAGGAASGDNSFAFERGIASADYSFAFGSGSEASGVGGIAFMRGIASGQGSFAIGVQNGEQRHPEASGIGSIAIGASVYSTGIYSVAIGTMANATANMAIAIGNRAIASSASQLAVGKYNIEDANSTYAFIIGNGSSSARSNAMTVDWNGNISANNIVTSTSVSNTGLISFLNSNSTAVYTVQLPLYNGGVS